MGAVGGSVTFVGDTIQLKVASMWVAVGRLSMQNSDSPCWTPIVLTRLPDLQLDNQRLHHSQREPHLSDNPCQQRQAESFRSWSLGPLGRVAVAWDVLCSASDCSHSSTNWALMPSSFRHCWCAAARAGSCSCAERRLTGPERGGCESESLQPRSSKHFGFIVLEV